MYAQTNRRPRLGSLACRINFVHGIGMNARDMVIFAFTNNRYQRILYQTDSLVDKWNIFSTCWPINAQLGLMQTVP